MAKNLLFFLLFICISIFHPFSWSQSYSNFTVNSKGEDTVSASKNTVTGFKLNNYPNPFNLSTNIQFNIPNEGAISLEIFNILGNKVRTLLTNQYYTKGYYSIEWDSKNDKGSQCSTGVYIIKLKSWERTITGRALLIK
jgi:flagellar hook assembly protein FlgD